ncbi:hypothetical protein IscW_ISCW016656 [Ixodes scapularis]|uniref:Uncharacterized protein n=1 Tax=Ixodes scapularis TaxID=6945 RepID=B7P8P4_IXOSC|nr:hypothetical protein IscW_ISCW016656 [Ixodes scapularis]|eukprot:XP_002402528.1 hypothetical protein IscW_ISCW016656 [Ixodes scapularis]
MPSRFNKRSVVPRFTSKSDRRWRYDPTLPTEHRQKCIVAAVVFASLPSPARPNHAKKSAGSRRAIGFVGDSERTKAKRAVRLVPSHRGIGSGRTRDGLGQQHSYPFGPR